MLPCNQLVKEQAYKYLLDLNNSKHGSYHITAKMYGQVAVTCSKLHITPMFP